MPTMNFRRFEKARSLEDYQLVEEFIQDISRSWHVPDRKQLERWARNKLGDRLFELFKDDLFKILLGE